MVNEKKERTVIDKFYDFWDTLSELEQDNLYALLCLVRGPDEEKEVALKFTTTGLVRSLLFKNGKLPAIYGYGNVQEVIGTLGEYGLRSHFISHADRAFRVLHLLGITEVRIPCSSSLRDNFQI